MHLILCLYFLVISYFDFELYVGEMLIFHMGIQISITGL